jgi:SAM-dependent methyltransferase
MKEEDIRPQGVFQEYLRLSQLDALTWFGSGDRTVLPCPGCGSQEFESVFEKHGFAYSRCRHCATLYQSPRPARGVFESFYSSAPSSSYWADTFFPTVAESRRSRIFKPRVQRIESICRERDLLPATIVDVGAGWGIFLEEWGKLFPTSRRVAIEPSAALASRCREAGLEVMECFAEDVPDQAVSGDLVTCFEVLEHVYSPLEFASVMLRLVRPGGIAVVSTLCADGFDLAVLQSRSDSIFPPHHINFLSKEGLRRVFSRAGFSSVDVITPGQLDVEIVRNHFAANPEFASQHRFLANLVSDSVAAEAFQGLLQESGLSSHAWVIAVR